MCSIVRLSSESYLKIYEPSLDLTIWIEKNFDKIFSLHPIYDNNEKSKILLFNKNPLNPQWNEIETHRWFESYLNTPEYNNKYHKSYMFGSLDKKEIKKELPNEINYLFQYAKNLDNKYNQVVVNWYEKENDYIPAHSDWVDGMIPDYNIGFLNLYGKHDKVRNFKITNKNSGEIHSMPLFNGEFVIMCGKFQDEFRHEVEKISDKDLISRRIGISFRQYI